MCMSVRVFGGGGGHDDLCCNGECVCVLVLCLQTLLSLSKLSLLATSDPTGSGGGDGESVEHLNSLLHHIRVQEDIPKDVVSTADMDSDLMPPLSPQEIVEVSVCALSWLWV